MEKTAVSLQFQTYHNSVVLTNVIGDTYTSKSEDLMDFLDRAKEFEAKQKTVPLAIDKKAEKILKLIDVYWKFDNNQLPMSSWHDKQDLLTTIKEYAEQLNQDKWVSVEKELPNVEPKRVSSDWVLTFDKENCRIDKAFYSEITGWQAEHGEKMFVTHWMELPEPPSPPKTK